MKNSDFVQIDPAIQHAWQAFMRAHNRQTIAQQQQRDIQLLWQQSPYAMRVCQRYPHQLDELLTISGSIDQSLPCLHKNLSVRLAGLDDEQQYKQCIREFRHFQCLLICWQELILNTAIETILTALSNVADVCVQVSVAWLHERLQSKHGQPLMENQQAAEMCVLALGKLGGRELNFSSDIDLVFCYSGAGQTAGPSAITHQEYFTLLGQKLIDLLGSQTVDGFVYRIDCRLRPFGESGPLVVSFDSLEEYFITHGREWERYAFLKARMLTGSDHEQRIFASIRQNFVYRKYVDFTVIHTLREMKDLIAQQEIQKGNSDNIKLGQGGIREIEFIIQFFQLVYGGRELALQTNHIFDASQFIAQLGYLTQQEVSALLAAYKFLRQTENRLQMSEDEQTHQLPDKPDDQVLLARSMDFETAAGFQQQLAMHRNHVNAVFLKIRSDQEQPTDRSSYCLIWDKYASEQGDDYTSLLSESGFKLPQQLHLQLGKLVNSVAYRKQDSLGRSRLNSFMPNFLSQLVDADLAEKSLSDLFMLVQSILRRSIYLVMLDENEAILKQLIKVSTASPWIVNHLTTYPLLLDELVHPLTAQDFTDRLVLQDHFQAQVLSHQALSYEQILERVRYFKHAHELRIACADVSGTLTLMRVSDQLSWLAEVMVNGCISCLRQDFGSDIRDHIGVIAFGKLGGLEMSYGSDLDLVYVAKNLPVEQSDQASRQLQITKSTHLVQRLTQMLTLQTVSGRLYEVDTRLRPDGAAGALLTSFDFMRDYYQQRAWIWEIQALVRARCIAGDESLVTQFNDLRQSILRQARDPQQLAQEVNTMRQKMLAEKASKDARRFHLKHDLGGITDIEFMVQYMVLAYASDHAELCMYSDNIRLLECCADIAVIPAATAQELSDIYRQYRQVMHTKALLACKPEVSSQEYISAREKVRECWNQIIGR